MLIPILGKYNIANIYKTLLQLIDSRNSLSHDTDYEFAALLQQKRICEQEYGRLWRQILCFIHDSTIEDLAAKYKFWPKYIFESS